MKIPGGLFRANSACDIVPGHILLLRDTTHWKSKPPSMRHSRPTRLIEIANIRRAGMRLHVAGVEIVQYVEHAQPRPKLEAVAVELEVERLLHFRVQPYKRSQASGLITLPDVVPVAVQP
jgi:hypothetical protein